MSIYVEGVTDIAAARVASLPILTVLFALVGDFCTLVVV